MGRRELQAKVLGAQICLKLVLELGSLIKNFLLCSDALVGLCWVLNKNDVQLKMFIQSRVQVIRSSLNRAYEHLHQEHKDQEINSSAAQSTPGTTDYQDHLFWVPGELNTPDIGTKYRKFGTSTDRMLTASDCAPNSPHFNRLPWMKDIEGSIKKEIIKSIRTLKNKWDGTNDVTNEDAKAFQDGVKPTNTSKIKKQEKIILDGKP